AGPGANVRGVAPLSATASDGGAGVDTLVYQYSPAGQAAWTATPALWDTTALPDGRYDLRAVATDGAGNAGTSPLVPDVRVDNTAPAVTMSAPGALLRGTAALGSTSSDAGSGIADVRYQYSPAGQEDWRTTDGSFDTTTVADGLYDLHAVATDNAGNSTTSASITGVRIDNTAPTTLDNAPPDAQSADVTVTLSPSDAGSGVASTEDRIDSGSFQSGTTVLVPAPADHSNDGAHTIEFRSTDGAGNVEQLRTATVRIDTTPPSASVVDPG